VSFPHGYSFKPGVVTTVEPGYYKEGEFGVRTESLFVCKEVEVCHHHTELVYVSSIADST
jgi:Xaa-Pro aminopeptidase